MPLLKPSRSTAEDVTQRQFRPPKGLNTVCPEIGECREQFYDAPAIAIANRLRLLPMSFDASEDHPSRLSWQYAVAVEAINMLDHFPLQAIVNVHGEQKWDFHRAVFWRGLVAGLGSWLHRINLKTQRGQPINPLTQGWQLVDRLSDPSKGSRYPCTVAPSTAEFMIASESGLMLLSESLEPRVRNLYLDAFGADHHSRNPVASAVARAQIKVRKRLNNRGFLIDDKPGIGWMNPTEVLQIESYVTAPTTSGASHGESPAQSEHEPVEEPTHPAREPGSATVTTSASDPEPDMRSKQDLKSAGISVKSQTLEAKTPTKPASGAPTDSEIDPRLVAKLIRDRLKSGVLMCNRLGAQVEVGPHGVGLVLPKTIYQLAEMLSVPHERLEAVIMQHMVDPERSYPKLDYRLHRPGRGWNKLKLAVLTDEWAAQIFPEGSPPANPAIKVSESTDK